MSKRSNFGQLKEVIQPPNLIENQINSFKEFLQMDVPPSQRKTVGLEAVFSEVFPIESYDSRCHLEYVSYSVTPPRDTEINSIRDGVTYSVSLYVKLRLREEEHIKDEEIYMGEFPMISERGSFIINGAERVIVSQLHRSPGIAFEESVHTSGKTLHAFRIMPDRGTWLEVQFDQNDLLFQDPRRYDLGRVGRYKLNQKLKMDTDLEYRIVAADDVVEATKYLSRLKRGDGTLDDIDHLGSRRVRTVGELLANQCRVGLARTERLVKERMTLYDQSVDSISPQKLINPKALSTVIRDFFARSQLSQFMDQINPLAELTHKRRLSALGPGGLNRERAGYEVRDVHPSHYGRICPIEPPEGPNIGLINSLSLYSRINEFGFIETPYRKVVNGRVADDVEYLNADQEEPYMIAQANSEIDEDGCLIGRVTCRNQDEVLELDPSEVHYMDVSPKQLISVAAGLIPFLEHDDANRALMGSNMQRQGVPLLQAEAPFVGTGIEARVATDSKTVEVADIGGIIASVDANRIVLTHDGEMPARSRDLKTDAKKGIFVYQLRKFMRSNAGTCFNQKPIVHRGQPVKKGDILADGASTDQGDLAIGRNILVAFMPWNGYNFEDAILISEKIVKDDIFTSIHVDEFEVTARDTKLGPEEITRDIPNVGEEALKDLNHDGVIRVGAEVKPGDILVGKITPKSETEVKRLPM